MDQDSGHGGFRAIVVDKPLADARPEAVLRRLDTVDHPADGGLVVDVMYSSVNYKDAIALTGGPGILRETPLVPGIDVVGRVREANGAWSVGDLVLVNGAGVGERTDGGLAERAVIPADSVIGVPDGMDPRIAAAFGTAGFTAALSVQALARRVDPSDGEIAVTGAGGGVGMFTVALLAARGFSPVAVTGRADSLTEILTRIGAHRVIGREEIGSEVGKPLQRAAWAGAVDSVGSATLVNLLAQTRARGTVTACGLAQASDLPGTVLPFILRGVSLIGINSVEATPTERVEAWEELATLSRDIVDVIAPRTEPLDRAVSIAREVLAGRVAGRVVIDVRA